MPQYLRGQPYTVRAVLCVLSVKSNGGMLLGLFKWEHTGAGTAEAQGTRLIEIYGRSSGWRAKSLQQGEQTEMLKQNLLKHERWLAKEGQRHIAIVGCCG